MAQLRDQWEAVATRTLQRLDAALPVLLDVLGALREAMPRSVEKEVKDKGHRAWGVLPSVCGWGWAVMRDTHNSVIFISCTYTSRWCIVLFEQRAFCLVAFSSSACRPFRWRRRRGVGSFRRPPDRAFSRSCGTWRRPRAACYAGRFAWRCTCRSRRRERCVILKIVCSSWGPEAAPYHRLSRWIIELA